MSALDGFYTVAELVKRNPQVLTQGGLRHYLANRYSNGLEASGAVIRPRKKLYINETSFFAWYLSGQTRGTYLPTKVDCPPLPAQKHAEAVNK